MTLSNSEGPVPPWSPRASPETPPYSGDDIRWRTNWWLMVIAGLFCAMSVWAGIDDRNVARAFARDALPVTATVVESDRCLLCRTGPIVSVRYEHPTSGTIVARLVAPQTTYRLGSTVEVVYSDAPAADGAVVPAAVVDDLGDGTGSFVAAGVGALLALLAWAFPANLRRLDRRDAGTR